MTISSKISRYLRLTPEIVKNFGDTMFARVGLTPVRKQSAWQMWWVGTWLDCIGILDKDKFMYKYSTVLGKKVYLPFKIGDPEDFSLLAQVVTITHESQHGYQRIKDGFKFVTRYGFSSAKRAAYETEAYACNLEIYHWLTGRILDPERLARSLENYNCTEGDIAIATKSLKVRAALVECNSIVTTATKEAVKILQGL